MFITLESLLLNLFFILLTIFLRQLWIDKDPYKNEIQNFSFFITMLLAILLCIMFPLSLGHEYRIDLRTIPFVIGTIYGGWRVGGALLIATIAFRFLYGGTGFLISLIHFSLVYGMTVLVTPYYHRLQNAWKYIFLTIFIGISAFFILVVGSLFSSDQLVDSIGLFITMHMLGICLVLYVLETFRKNRSYLDSLIKMEKLQVVSHLAASVSHEVRNPLTATKGFLQLLQQAPDLHKDQRNQYIKIALEELERAEIVIKDYLTFARPEEQDIQLLSLSNEVERVVEIMTPYANLSGVELIVQPIDNVVIKGNHSQFQQALVNVIKNAIEAKPKNGKIEIDCSLSSSSVMLMITDTGIGMTKEQLNRMGEPYYSTKGPSNGTGLGMMVVYQIIRAMKGTISIHSELNVGTSIRLTFPVVGIER